MTRHDPAAAESSAALAARADIVTDPARLADLHGLGVLDTEAEEVFDRLTRLAVRLVSVPAAFVSLVDADRDFYKSACGFGEPLASARELTGPTFCHETVRQNTPLVIADTAADVRYRAIPTVRTLGVAAYVGVPLLVDGLAVGAFCAIDAVPRDWTDNDLEVLTALAAAAQRELEMRAAVRLAEVARAEVATVNVQLTAQQGELERVNARLQAQQVELEARAHALQQANATMETALADAVCARRDAETAHVDAEVARARLGDVFQQAPAFIAALRGPDHVFELANRDYYQLVGHRDILGRPVREALPEVVDQGFVALLDRVLATGEPFHGREMPVLLVRTPDTDPEERFVNFIYQALVEGDGSRSGVFVHAIDVTDSVRARRAVEEASAALVLSERRYRTLTEAVPVQVWTATADGRLDFVSEQATTFFGATAGDLLGTGWSTFVHPDDLAPAVARWTHAVATGEPYQAEFRLRSASTREYRWHLARALAETDAAGQVTGWVGTNTDVEDEYRLRYAAEDGNRAKTAFLAVMSHELRTPLGAIDGYAALIEGGVRGPVSDEALHDLGRIRANGRHLLGLINGILQYAQVDAGVVRYALDAVAVEDVLAACEVFTAPQLQAKGVTFLRQLADPTVTVRADREKLQQIMLNLLTNAIKFTAEGGQIDLRWARSDAPQGPLVRIAVGDTGIGIAPENVERVFQPFVQVDALSAAGRQGTGLGLAISRDLAHGMGGSLSVESTLGVGSVFTLTLPAAGAD